MWVDADECRYIDGQRWIKINRCVDVDGKSQMDVLIETHRNQKLIFLHLFTDLFVYGYFPMLQNKSRIDVLVYVWVLSRYKSSIYLFMTYQAHLICTISMGSLNIA